ncbi:MAG: hypothetical protein WCJ70_01815 [bacterium]
MSTSPPKLNPDQLKAARQQMAKTQFESKPEKSSDKSDPSVAALKRLADPNEWLRQLYGAPEPATQDEHMRDTEKAQKQGKQSSTPLDMKKLGEKHDAQDLQKAREQFNWYKSETDKVIHENKKKEQEKQRAIQEEEQKKKKEEEERRQQEQAGGDEPTGKQKGVLGQPRRKATTDRNPETKVSGSK